MFGSPDSKFLGFRKQWLCTTLYSGIKAGSISFRSGVCPSMMADGGRHCKDDVVGALLGAEMTVVGALVASFPAHDSGQALSNEARGTPCV